jgi:hypothetical protein
VLLTAARPPASDTGDTPLHFANAADCLAQVGDDLPDNLDGLARVWFLFDADNLETARHRWRRLGSIQGVRPVYWREGEDGRFEKAG